MAKTIRDVMTENVIVMNENDTARDAARRMKENEIGDVLVQNDDGGLCGVVTDRDIVLRDLAEGRDGGSKLGEICTRELETLSPSDSIDDAVRKMKQKAVRRLPVVDGERPVGIVSLGDLAVEQDKESALGKISAAPSNN